MPSTPVTKQAATANDLVDEAIDDEAIDDEAIVVGTSGPIR
jgi:hypothetical protein